ncbi:peptidoglycan D,D-transpeptidase FtsI family protein [Thiomicrorhabdus arctica]|uniref:peptidoglycan D,D-transpeptidase FtsI family protein n=1 Tax=Thiomicrorhabdus arctica TaxID=131540 RepID=UPI00037CE211|nr:penicillin-binding protein 2 [Thiomicrorhabdus arctica]
MMISPKIIRRDRVVFFLITLGFMAIIGRAFYVQVIKTDFLQSEGDKRQIRTIEIPASRGNIFDRNGELMALSTPMAAVWVDPEEMTSHEQKYLKFLSLLNLTDSQLNQYIRSNKHKRLSFIQQVSDKGIIDKIAKLELPGTYTKYVDIDFENNGRIIHVDKLLPSVWVEKRLIDRYRYSYARLAQALGMTTRELAHKIRAKPNRRFMYLKRSMVPEIAKKIEDMNLTGVYTQGEYKRYYPSGESNAHLLGFTNIDDKGLEGVELAYNDWLRGTPGKKQVVKDRAGHVVDFVKDIVASKPGKSITLSIDQNIQYFAYRALKEVMVKHQATSASSVILDAKTGEVLSMVSLPGYNPNDSSQRSGIAIRNRVVTDLLEPGSTVKPFVIAKALDLGLIDLDTLIDTSPGSIRVQGERISDTRNHGILTPMGIIQKSSNVGVSKVALKLSPKQQHDFMSQLGFGRDSGLFLPGEAMGYLKPAADWHDLDQASSSYGYSFNINLLNLAHSYLLFTNQGKILPLSVIKLEQAPEGESLVKAKVADEVLKMMESAVSDQGTAPKAQIPGYRVAGKTGTVHKTKRGGYEENSYMALFAGIVPVSDPQFIMAISVNEPSRGVYYGGLVAAPIFKEVMQEALRLRNVAPDKLIDGHGQGESK